MKNWILKKWDCWVYRMAFHTMKRMAKRNAGFSYLLELHIREYNSRYPIPDSLKRATELFHESLVDLAKKNEVDKEPMLDEKSPIDRLKKHPHEIICTKCGLREQRGEKPRADF